MVFDGFVTKAVVTELNSTLISGKINKIFVPNKNEVIIEIYSNKNNYKLLLSTHPYNCRIHLTNHTKPNPISAAMFCMVLRKHLLNGKIINIVQSGLERIVQIVIETYNELNDLVTKTLIIEIMGKHSNIILINENNSIIDSIKHVDNTMSSIREVMPSRKYTFPRQDKINFSICCFEEFLKYIESNIKQNISILTLDRLIADTFIGFSRFFVQNILNELDIDFSKNITSTDELYTIYAENILKKIFDYINNFDLENNINYSVDEFYYIKETNEILNNTKNNLIKNINSLIKKTNNAISSINKKIEECSQMEDYRIKGELLSANMYKLSPGLDKIFVQNFYDSNNEIEIILESSLSPSGNLQKYFKKYTKLKKTLDIVLKQKKEKKDELNYLNSILFEIESTENDHELDEICEEITSLGNKYFSDKNKKNNLKQKKTLSEPHKFNINGFEVLVGKNNRQNDKLTHKMAKNNDIWLHTKNIHGSHVIIKTEGKPVDNDTLIKSAQIAAYYSKAKESSNVPVDYTFIRFVKKLNSTNPGMVIYTEQKTLYVNPDKLLTFN